MPCLFAESMNMNNTLWHNTLLKFQEWHDNQTIRYANVSQNAIGCRSWITFILTATALYLPICWGLKAYYKDRKAFPYRTPVILWNVTLSVLSGLGSLVILLYQPDIITHKADPIIAWEPITRAGVHPYVSFVVRVFCITKFVEYGDTFWLCVKKRPTIFLHLYHHITVTLYCLHALLMDASYGHFFAFVNLNIHAVMYGYYAAAIVFKGNKILNAMRPFITLGQLSQMFFGLAICIMELTSDIATPGLEINATLGFLMYASYAYLFGDFFCKNYKKNLSATDTLLALTPVAALPICLFSFGWMNLLFTPWTTFVAAATVAVLAQMCGASAMSCLSPIYYFGEEARNCGVEENSVRCMSKKIGIDSHGYSRMAIGLVRYSALPCAALFVDSIVTTHPSARSMPLVCTVWIVHAYFGGAWDVQKSETKKSEEVPQTYAAVVTKQHHEDEVRGAEDVVIRRTVPRAVNTN